MSNNSNLGGAIYDARTLGKPRMFVLGFQHMFAMFGAVCLLLLISTTCFLKGAV